jgi:hypothetical protein
MGAKSDEQVISPKTIKTIFKREGVTCFFAPVEFS